MSKLTKEETALKEARREKLKKLLLGGVVDLQGANDLETNLRKEIIDDDVR